MYCILFVACLTFIMRQRNCEKDDIFSSVYVIEFTRVSTTLLNGRIVPLVTVPTTVKVPSLAVQPVVRQKSAG